MMHQHIVNGNRLVQVCTLLELAKEVYTQSGFADSYGLVYNLFADIPTPIVREILSGEHEVYQYPHKNRLMVFYESEVPE